MGLNPTCTVYGDAPPQNAVAGDPVDIALKFPAGVAIWALTVVSCDDQNSVAAIQATLVVNQTSKTAVFTAPADLGSAVILQSVVGTVNGLGLDTFGNVDPSYTTTFKVNVPASNGLHVIASGEVSEENTAVGWIEEINAAVRVSGSATILGYPPPIDFAVGLVNASSSSSLVAGSKCLRLLVNITTAYSSGASLSVGLGGSSPILDLLVEGVDLTVAGEFWFDLPAVLWPSTAPVQATVAGGPSVGACELTLVAGPVVS
jgi:hypothetical protein